MKETAIILGVLGTLFLLWLVIEVIVAGIKIRRRNQAMMRERDYHL